MTSNDNGAMEIDPFPPVRRGRPRVPTIKVRLSPASYARLLRSAEHRALDPRDLASRIVQTVLEHNLINAVLDDEA